MKKSLKLSGAKKLTRNDQKLISGGINKPPSDPQYDGCSWGMCKNQFGRCSAFACPDSI